MRCAQYAGPVGALAVTLGVGLALIGAPGIARADDTAGGSAASDSPPDGSNATPPQDHREASTPQPSDSKESGSTGEDNRDGAGVPENTTSTTQSRTTIGAGGSPAVTIGGTTVEPSDGTESGGEAEGADGDGPTIEPAPSTDAVPPLGGETLAETVQAPSSAPVGLASGRGAKPPLPEPTLAPISATVDVNASRVPATSERAPDSIDTQRVTVLSAASSVPTADVPAAANQLLDPVATPAKSADPAEAVLRISDTVIRVALDLVSAVLSPLGPGAPADNPFLLGILAWSRRQFTIDSAPQGVQQVTTALVQATSSDQVTVDAEEEVPDYEESLENFFDLISVIPGAGNVVSGFALALDIAQILGAIGRNDAIDFRDEAGDIAGDLAGLIFDWPLDLIADDIFKGIADAIVNAVLESAESGPAVVATR